MKTTFLLVSIFAIFLFTGCDQNNEKESSKEFSLSGKFVGNNTDYLVLQYIDSSYLIRRDTIKIQDNKFFIEGTICNPQMIILKGNMKTIYMEDPNLARFFLDADKMQITLVEDDFKSVKIKGSKTQREFEILNTKTKSIYNEIAPLMQQRNELTEEKKKSDNPIDIDNRMNNVTSQWKDKLGEIKTIELTYSLANPDSYLSAYLVNNYQNIISKDSLKMFYDNFEKEIKETSYAKQIKDKINKSILKPGDIAPNFNAFDANEKAISLHQFKGSYVLLDFWASWCVPCKEKHPELKKLYAKYHPKGLEIIGISFDKDEDSWKKGIKIEEVDLWNHIYVGFQKGKSKGSIRYNYNIQPIPAYILIDKDGYVVERYLNASSENKGFDELESALAKIFHK